MRDARTRVIGRVRITRLRRIDIRHQGISLRQRMRLRWRSAEPFSCRNRRLREPRDETLICVWGLFYVTSVGSVTSCS